MILDRRPEFRRPRVGPYRQTRISRAIHGIFALVATVALWSGILVIFSFHILAGGTGADSIDPTRKDWIRIVVIFSAVAAIITFLFMIMK